MNNLQVYKEDCPQHKGIMANYSNPCTCGVPYEVKWEARVICYRTVFIRDESDPYVEIKEVADTLTHKDFALDYSSIEIESLKPEKSIFKEGAKEAWEQEKAETITRDI